MDGGRGHPWGYDRVGTPERRHIAATSNPAAQHLLPGSNRRLNKHSIQDLLQLTDYRRKKKSNKNSRFNLNLFRVYFGAQNKSLCHLYQSISGPFLRLAVTPCGFSLRGNHRLVQTPSGSMEFQQMMGSHLLSEREKNVFTVSEVLVI